MVMKFAKYFKTPFICMNKIHMLFPISSRSITNTVRLQSCTTDTLLERKNRGETTWQH